VCSTGAYLELKNFIECEQLKGTTILKFNKSDNIIQIMHHFYFDEMFTCVSANGL